MICRTCTLASLSFLLLATGSRAANERCSLADGLPWREYTSQHFVIDIAGTDGDPAVVVGAFEDLYAAVLGALIAEPVEIPVRVRVIVLAQQSDLGEYAGSNDIEGLFWVSSGGEPTILISRDNVKAVPQVIAHELTHYVSSYLFPRQPFWFAEGLAQFVEGVAKVDREGRRWAGSDPTGGWAAGSIKLSNMKSLLAGKASGEWNTDPYLSSWILYRFLWNERSKQLSAYQRYLMDGEAPDDAWRLAFPEWAGNKAGNLDEYVYYHQLKGRGARWEIKLGHVDRSFTAGPASAGDLHLALLEPRLRTTNPLVHKGLRLGVLEEAEREDPGHPIVTAELARLRETPLLPALRAATRARPADGRGWFLLGLEAVDPSERESALRLAVQRWPQGALAQAALAAHLATTGRAREALPFANRAVELAPWHPTAVSSLATVAVELGQCKQALILQTRAAETSASHGIGSMGTDPAKLKERLADLQRRCSSQSSGAAASGPAK